MLQSTDLPSEIPVMSLNGVVLFPYGVLPLFIFEPRYRQMLTETLEGDRIFGIATLNPESTEEENGEPIFPIVGVGYIKIQRTNSDGTSNLILEGFCRARVKSILREEPYRVLAVEPIHSIQTANEPAVKKLRLHIVQKLTSLRQYGYDVPQKILRFLEDKSDEVFAFMVANTWCECLTERIDLLGEPDVTQLYIRLNAILTRELKNRSMFQKLQGDLDEDNISLN